MTIPRKSAVLAMVSVPPRSIVRWFGKADPRPPGFYSVLSKSDRPLVRSNGKHTSRDSRHSGIHSCIRLGKSLQFSRGTDGEVSPRLSGGNILTIKNQLYKQFTDCPPDSWTSVELELRVQEPLPVLADLTRFLVSSVAFLTNIDTISIYLDGQEFLHIQKQSFKSPIDILIPPHLKPTTPSQILTVESIQRTGKATLATFRHF